MDNLINLHKIIKLSFVFRLAPTTSLNSTFLTFMPVSLHPFFSCHNWQTTQAWLATPNLKLPQPRVNLKDIAATPAVHRCCVSAAHGETRILALAVQVRDRRSRISSQKQWHKGGSAHYVRCWSHVQTRFGGRFIQLDHFWIATVCLFNTHLSDPRNVHTTWYKYEQLHDIVYIVYARIYIYFE